MQIKKPNVAGQFYPEDKWQLKGMLGNLLGSAKQATAICPKAIIAPHAGYIYSGEVAASAYINVSPFTQQFSKIVLLGPAHCYPFQGVVTSTCDYFETPLGQLKLASDDIKALQDKALISLLDVAFEGEHSLEVHLPFIQAIFQNIQIIPLLVGNASPKIIGNILQHFWQQENVFIVISSDLSHFHTYEVAKEKDEKTVKAILEKRYQDINHGDACGCLPIQGLLLLLQSISATIELLDLRNSGDTAGDKSRVVGYSSFLIR